MWKKCIKCGTIIPAEIDSRCELHPKRWHSGSTREWRKTRERILARDGFAAPFTYDRASAARGRSCSRSTTETAATCSSFLTKSSAPFAASTIRAEARGPRFIRSGDGSPRARPRLQGTRYAEKARKRGPSLVRRVVLPGLLRPGLHLFDDDLAARDLGRIRKDLLELLLA